VAESDRSPWRLALWLLILSLIVISSGSATAPLMEPDEGRYADIAANFLQSGDWVVPLSNGIPWRDKPPLALWATAGSFRLFGQTNFAARLVPMLSGVLGIALAFYAALVLTRRPQAAKIAALTLIASPVWVIVSKTLVLDIPFAMLLASSFFFLLCGAGVFGEGRYRTKLFGGFLLGLAILTKGPAALVLAGASALACAVFERDRDFAKRLLDPIPWILALAVASPWFLLYGSRNPEGLQAFILRENLQRFVQWHEHQHGLLYYPACLLAGLFATNLLLILGRPLSIPKKPQFKLSIMTLISSAPAPEHRGRRALALFCLVNFAIFSLASSKIFTYLLPCFPFIAVLTGDLLSLPGDADAEQASKLTSAKALLGLVFFVLIAIPIATAIGSRSSSFRVATIAASGWSCLPWLSPALIAALPGLRLLKQSRTSAARDAIICAFALIFLGLSPALAAVTRFRSAEPVARAINARSEGKLPVLVYRHYCRGLPYFLGRPVIQTLSTAENQQDIYRKHRPDLLLINHESIVERLRQKGALYIVIPQGHRRDSKRNRRLEEFLTLAAKAGLSYSQGNLKRLGGYDRYELFLAKPRGTQ